MVGPQEDNRVARCAAISQGFQHATDKGIGEGDTRKVMLYCCSPAACLSESAKIAGFLFCEPAPGTGYIVKIFREVFGDMNLLGRVEIEVSAWGVPGQMRMEESAGEEERFAKFLSREVLKVIGRKIGDQRIVILVLSLRQDAPVGFAGIEFDS